LVFSNFFFFKENNDNNCLPPRPPLPKNYPERQTLPPTILETDEEESETEFPSPQPNQPILVKAKF
jgi:hypothetical protein